MVSFFVCVWGSLLAAGPQQSPAPEKTERHLDDEALDSLSVDELLNIQLYTDSAPIAVDPATCTGGDTVNIGLLSFTVHTESNRSEGVSAAELAVREINEQGGLLGRRLVLIPAHSAGDVDVARAKATELIERFQVSAIVGPLFSRTAIPVAKTVTIPAGVPLITPGATADLLTAGDNGLVFRTIPNDGREAAASAEFVRRRLGAPSAAVLFMDDAYGRGLAETFAARFQRLGGQTTQQVSYSKMVDYESVDISGKMERLLAHNPDIIYVAGFATMGIRLAEELQKDRWRRLGFPPRVFASGAMGARTFTRSVERVGSTVAYGIRSAPPQHQGFLQAFFEHTGKRPEAYLSSAATYDAVYLLAYAMLTAADHRPSAFAPEVRGVSAGGTRIDVNELNKAKELLAAGGDIDYDGASGELALDEHGDIAEYHAEFWRAHRGEDSVVHRQRFIEIP